MLIGGIYPVAPKICPCGRRLVHLEGRGVQCPDHPEVRAARLMLRFRSITRRYDSYEEAWYALAQLRREAAKADFDESDYLLKANPYRVDRLLDVWLSLKKHQVKASTYKKLEYHTGHVRTVWGPRSLKDLGFADVQKLLLELKDKSGKDLASKTKHNILSDLKQFWSWANDARDVPLPKKWPVQRYEMKYRKTIDLETQEAVLENVRENEHNPRLWFALKILATYPSVRPGELIQLIEGDVDRKNGLLTLRSETVKTHERKIVPLIDEDADFIRSLPPAMPHMPFFRHDKPADKAHIKPGTPVGRHTFYKAWKRACARLGLKGVDLYGGTKHSTAMALRGVLSHEDTKQATMHHTNTAAERYFRLEQNRLRALYETRRKLLKKD